MDMDEVVSSYAITNGEPLQKTMVGRKGGAETLRDSAPGASVSIEDTPDATYLTSQSKFGPSATLYNRSDAQSMALGDETSIKVDSSGVTARASGKYTATAEAFVSPSHQGRVVSVTADTHNKAGKSHANATGQNAKVTITTTGPDIDDGKSFLQKILSLNYWNRHKNSEQPPAVPKM